MIEKLSLLTIGFETGDTDPRYQFYHYVIHGDQYDIDEIEDGFMSYMEYQSDGLDLEDDIETVLKASGFYYEPWPGDAAIYISYIRTIML